MQRWIDNHLHHAVTVTDTIVVGLDGGERDGEGSGAGLSTGRVNEG